MWKIASEIYSLSGAMCELYLSDSRRNLLANPVANRYRKISGPSQSELTCTLHEDSRNILTDPHFDSYDSIVVGRAQL